MKNNKVDFSVLRIKDGFPILCSSDVINLDDTEIKKPFGRAFVDSFSTDEMMPERSFMIQNFVKTLSSNTACEVIVTSHDQNRMGQKRRDSEGHLKGYATDFIFSSNDDKKDYHPLVDLGNSVSFLSYLRTCSKDIFASLARTGNLWGDNPLIIGIEYDHLHIEWPWSTRTFPMVQGLLLLKEVPSRIIIALFYNPQPSYQLPDYRSGYQKGLVVRIS